MVMIEIIKAKYGGKDVTPVLKNSLKNGKLILKVGNGIFGDPTPGRIKTLEVDYKENGINKSTSLTEGGMLILPFTKNNKLGIFYTNNNLDPNVLKQSLASIKKAADKNDVDIITSVWKPIPDNPFAEVICNVKTGNHFNIAYQISQLLLTAKASKKYDVVYFLEHDVLYGEDYFNLDDFKGNVICNDNYMGVCKHGWQNKGQNDEPLHQLTLKFDYAISHFKNILMESITQGVNLEPPHIPAYSKRKAIQPSVHINHGNHFTSHYNVYRKIYHSEEPYWGNYKNIWK